MENTKRNMANDKCEGRMELELAPPAASHKYLIREPGKLVVQVLYLLVSFIPLMIWSFVENVFLTKRKSVRGKVVLVTGSARGLGRGFAEKFAKLGCRVACVDVNEQQNKETVAQINEVYPGRAKAYRCNVAVSEEICELKRNVYEDFKSVDIVVHNAGLLSAATPITELDDVHLSDVVRVNLLSHFLIYREFLPEIIEKNEGHIVAIGSVVSFSGMGRASLYCSTKHAVAGLMESLHYELNEIPNNNVQTSIVCPWFVNTSATYLDRWKIRLPELTIKQTVNKSVDGILKNKRIILVPSSFYYVVHVLKLLPDRIMSLVRNIFYVRLL